MRTNGYRTGHSARQKWSFRPWGWTQGRELRWEHSDSEHVKTDIELPLLLKGTGRTANSRYAFGVNLEDFPGAMYANGWLTVKTRSDGFWSRARMLQSIPTGIPELEDCRIDCETYRLILPPVAELQHKPVLFRVYSTVQSAGFIVRIGLSVCAGPRHSVSDRFFISLHQSFDTTNVARFHDDR